MSLRERLRQLLFRRPNTETRRLQYAQWAAEHHPDVGKRGLYARTVRMHKLRSGAGKES